MNSITRVLVIGEGPLPLTFTYYVINLNPRFEVHVAYVREDKPFEDTYLNLKPIVTEKYLESYGCEIISLKDVDFKNYDIIYDITWYELSGNIDGDFYSLNPITSILSNIKNKVVYVVKSEVEEKFDSDVLKFLMKATDRLSIVDRVERVENYCTVKVKKHVEYENTKFIGLGQEVTYLNVKFIVDDLLYAYRLTILEAINLALNTSIKPSIFWRSYDFGNVKSLIVGLTTKNIMKSFGKMPTTLSLTQDDTYIKLLTLYKQRGLVGYQIVSSSIDKVNAYGRSFYSLLQLISDDVPSRLLFVPRIFNQQFRDVEDVLIEGLIKEMYWMLYI